jgi:AraC-like DNA-binding protein
MLPATLLAGLVISGHAVGSFRVGGPGILSHRAVPLISEIELVAPMAYLAELGAPVETLLGQAKLPPRLQDPARGFVPARSLLGFLACGSRYLGQEDFAFRSVLREKPDRVGSWGALAARSWRLRDALQCFAHQVVRDAPFLEAGLAYRPAHAWLWRRRHLPPKDPLAELQGEQYTLASMLQIVRAVAGPRWVPPAVRIETQGSDWVLRAEGVTESPVSFGGRVMAIAVPYDLLDLRMPFSSEVQPIGAGGPERAPSDFVGSFQRALGSLAGCRTLSLELGAEIAETSPRTLRRWLAELGTSWMQVRDRVRFEACEEMIRQPSLKLADIASELGYSDQAAFTRAFHRWTGESPNDYRKRRIVQ